MTACQSAFTVRVFGEFTKVLKNFAGTPFRVYVSREGVKERESPFLKEISSPLTHC